jgi:hypothetical protein
MKKEIPKRRIRVGKQPPSVRKTQLWRVVGYDVVHGVWVIEDPRTEERRGVYSSTGACVSLTDNMLKTVGWGRDSEGKEIAEVKEMVQYIAPPDKKRPKHHTEACQCNECKPYQEMVDESDQPGD